MCQAIPFPWHHRPHRSLRYQYYMRGGNDYTGCPAFACEDRWEAHSRSVVRPAGFLMRSSVQENSRYPVGNIRKRFWCEPAFLPNNVPAQEREHP